MTPGGTSSWRWLAATAALLLVALAPAAQAPAAQAKVSAPQGDPSRGEFLAAPCAGCHGPQGRGGGVGFPHLAGQNYYYLIEQLYSMRLAARQRAGQETAKERAQQQRRQKYPRIAQRYRSNPVMDGYVLGLSDGDIRDLAAYYATRACAAAPARVPPPRPKVAARCAVCHGEGGVGDNPMVPILAGQDAPYLENQIIALRAAGRVSGPNGEQRRVGIMSREAASLDDQQIPALAAYYASLSCARPR